MTVPLMQNALTEKTHNTIKHKNLLLGIKMDKKILTFGDTEIEKTNYGYKSPVSIRNIDIGKVLLRNKITFSEKNYKLFIGSFYNIRVKTLHIMLPKTSAPVKSYDGQQNGCTF